MAGKVNFKGAFPQCRQTVVDEPVTAANIVDAIRDPRWVTRDVAITLIEQYAAVVAGEAVIKATEEAYAKCMAITNEAMSKPLAMARTSAERVA